METNCGAWFDGEYLGVPNSSWCTYHPEKWYPFDPSTINLTATERGDRFLASYREVVQPVVDTFMPVWQQMADIVGRGMSNLIDGSVLENNTCTTDSSHKKVYGEHCGCQGDMATERTYHVSLGCCQPFWLLVLSASVAGTIFLVLNVFLAYYGYQIYLVMRDSNGSFQVPFQPKGSSPKRILVITFLICFIFLTRTMFDFSAIAGLDFFDPSTGRPADEVATVLLYFWWEIVPTTSIIFLFFKIPKTDVGLLSKQMNPSKMNNIQTGVTSNENTPLFSDRLRYDSDEDDGVTGASSGSGGAGAGSNKSSATLYGTPHYPYMTASLSHSISVVGHSPYPTTTAGNGSYKDMTIDGDESVGSYESPTDSTTLSSVEGSSVEGGGQNWM
tara:strand:- start:247 stop:1407 length:1161 start_codon:yes stop_codon:yes gene_type:complete